MGADIVRDLELLIWPELIILILAHFVVKEVIQQSHNQSTIFVIGNSTTVIALSCEILEGWEWYLVIFVQKHLQLAD